MGNRTRFRASFAVNGEKNLSQLELWHAAPKRSERNRLRYQIDALYRKRRMAETKKWQSENKEKYLNCVKNYRTNNFDRIHQREKCVRDKYDNFDREKLRQKSRLWRNQNSIKLNEQKRKKMDLIYRDKSAHETYKEMRKKWRESNKDRIKLQAKEYWKRRKVRERIEKYGDARPRRNAWFKQDQPGYLYLMDRPDALKIGITSRDPWERKKELSRWGFSVIDCIRFKVGKEALDLETQLKRKIKDKGILLGQDAWISRFKGYTETWSKTDLNVGNLLELFGYLELAINVNEVTHA